MVFRRAIRPRWWNTSSVTANNLTHVSIVTDPVYLTEPLVKSEDFVLNTNAGGNWLYPCEEVEEVEGRPRGAVPNYLPGQNPFISEYANMYHLPLMAALGGPETMYPEFEKVVKNPPPTPSNRCSRRTRFRPCDIKNMAQNPNPTDGEVHVLPVQGNIYMLVGRGRQHHCAGWRHGRADRGHRPGADRR